jgi:hypothetical protein
MNSYATLDPQLKRRAKTEGWALFTEWAGAPARFFYMGGEGPWDCFQISINPPDAGVVKIWARSVDTNDDQEFEQAWQGPVAEFDGLLTSAVSAVDVWKRRVP